MSGKLIDSIELYNQLFGDKFKNHISINEDHYKYACNFIIAHKKYWIRSIDTWSSNSESLDKQFKSLIDHLFVQYRIPEFFYSIWYEQIENIRNNVFHFNQFEDVKEIKWFIEVAQGKNFRNCEDLPNTKLTKKVVHHMMKAPDHYSIYEAIRYGQVIDLGGTQYIANKLITTRLSYDFRNESFWLKSIEYFIKYPFLLDHVTEILDYLRAMKFQLNAPKPQYSLKNKKPENLRDEIRQWHKQLWERHSKNNQWSTNHIDGFIYAEKKTRYSHMWLIYEITTSKELYEEGRIMTHCIASYEQECLSGIVSIWSLCNLDTSLGYEKKLTIEVHNSSRMIVQVHGKCNRNATENEMFVIQKWMEKENLKLLEIPQLDICI